MTKIDEAFLQVEEAKQLTENLLAEIEKYKKLASLAFKNEIEIVKSYVNINLNAVRY